MSHSLRVQVWYLPWLKAVLLKLWGIFSLGETDAGPRGCSTLLNVVVVFLRRLKRGISGNSSKFIWLKILFHLLETNSLCEAETTKQFC